MPKNDNLPEAAEGYNAYLAGTARDANPHAEASEPWRGGDWTAGWDEAKADEDREAKEAAERAQEEADRAAEAAAAAEAAQAQADAEQAF